VEVAFSILLDTPAYNLARRYQLQISQKFHTFEAISLEPHATIKYAFLTDNLEKIEQYFDEVAQSTKPFSIDIEGISSFEENNVIILKIAKSEILKTLHFKVLKDLKQKFSVIPAQYEGTDFRFHITLAYKDISSDTFKQIMEFLKNEKPKLKISITKLGLWVKSEPTKQWILYKIDNLGYPTRSNE